MRGKKIKTIVVPKEITEMGIIPVKRSKTSHLLLVALSDGKRKPRLSLFSRFEKIMFFCVELFTFFIFLFCCYCQCHYFHSWNSYAMVAWWLIMLLIISFRLSPSILLFFSPLLLLCLFCILPLLFYMRFPLLSCSLLSSPVLTFPFLSPNSTSLRVILH